jgi:pyruvate/2-oxoglutarate/acetoin dehydrogenase E1 component
MYSKEVISKEDLEKQGIKLDVISEDGIDTYSICMVDVSLCHLTLASYGYHTSDLIKLISELAVEYEIFINLIICTQLNNGESRALIDSVNKTRNIITVEESLESLVWGDGVIFNLLSMHKLDIVRFKSFCSPCKVIPASRELEVNALINLKNVKEYIVENYQ